MSEPRVAIESQWHLTALRGFLTLRWLLDRRTPRQRAEDEAYEQALLAGLTYDLARIRLAEPK